MPRQVSPAVSLYLSKRLSAEKEKWKSQNKFAAHLKISGAHVANVIGKKRGVGWEVVEKIATALNMSTVELERIAEAEFAEAEAKKSSSPVEPFRRAEQLADDIARDRSISYQEAMVAVVRAGPIDDPIVWRREAVALLGAGGTAETIDESEPKKAQSRSSRPAALIRHSAMNSVENPIERTGRKARNDRD